MKRAATLYFMGKQVIQISRIGRNIINRLGSLLVLAMAFIIIGGASTIAQADNYFNGFEDATASWFSPTRVGSGMGTLFAPSATGSFHAEGGTDFTRWGGYSDDPACATTGDCTGPFPPLGYYTSIDIYLDVDGGFTNDTRFDFSSAINKPDGTHRRDFVIACGFYNDDDGSPGAGTNRYICSASNNTPGWPKDPGRMPTLIASTTGWYTFKHEFRDNGFGVLVVGMSVLDSSGTVIKTWTLSDPSDIINDTVGGNRYGWFVTNEFDTLAFDNTKRVSNAPDHLQCYDIDWSSRLDRKTVKLDDQFAVRENVRVGRKAEKYCTTVIKNEEQENNPDNTWTCYRVKGYKPKLKVKVNNQFGDQTFKLDESELLCVPSTQVEVTEVERRRHHHHHDDD